jgi:uncharacterized protein DUF4136
MRIVHIALATTAALALGACATMTVSSHVAPAVNLREFYTYAWGPADALPVGDARLDNDPYFHDYVQGAVEKQLAGTGLSYATAMRPADLLIHYHASINTRIDVNLADRERGYCYGDDCRARVVGYEAGTLVIDLVDARTNRVVWRGWAQDSVDGALDDADRLRRKIDAAVRRIFERFQQSSVAGGR